MKIAYDSRLLLSGLSNNAGRSGIFFVGYNMLKELSKNPNLDIYLYCQRDSYYLLKEAILKNMPEFGKIKLLYDCNFFDRIFYKLKIKKDQYKKEKKTVKRKILGFFIGINKMLAGVLQLFNNKNILKNIDVFFSPVFVVPNEVSKQKHIKCYTILHDTIPLIFKENYPDMAKGKYWFLDLINSPFNKDKRSNFLAVSQSTKNDFLKYVPSMTEDRITVMPIATSQKFYPDRDRQKLEKVLDKYNVSQQQRGKYIFSLCTLEPRKNLIFTIKCFIKFIKENNIDDLYFYLGGGHWDDFITILEKEIKDLDKYRDRIVKLGYVDDEDVNTLYSNSLFFTYISLYEGFGIPPLEAMSCGVPVLTSNVSSIPEVVGDAAIMINPKDEKSCIEAMRDLYYNENLRKELSKKGLEQAKKFSWTKTVDIIINKIQEQTC